MEPIVKSNWEKLQERYNFPVDALGRPIETSDVQTLNTWRGEGIDQFMTK